MNTEETRFTDAFFAVLRRDPNTAPGPTAINLELGKTRENQQRTPMNVLNGRMSALRIRLLEENGFVKEGDVWGRWVKS